MAMLPILAVLAIGFAAPYFKADRYREQIRRALESDPADFVLE